MHRIMLIDDEENILNALQRVMKRYKEWEVETYTQPADAIKRAQTHNFDLFISDYRMPEMNGAELLGRLKELQPQAVRLILSGYADLESLMNSINQAEIYRFIPKPWQDYELMTTIGKALEHRDALLENRVLADQLRAQQAILEKQQSVLEYYQKKHPDLLHIEWLDNGGIRINENDVEP